MNKKILALLLTSFVFSNEAFSAKIQQQGIVTASDCSARSISNANCLPLTAQVWDSFNDQLLSVSISSGLFNGGKLNAVFELNNAVVLYNKISAPHYQVTAASLSLINMVMRNSGLSGGTTIQIDQTRSGTQIGTATATLPANSGLEYGAQETVSPTLSLISGDVIDIDVIGVPSGTPSGLRVEY